MIFLNYFTFNKINLKCFKNILLIALLSPTISWSLDLDKSDVSLYYIQHIENADIKKIGRYNISLNTVRVCDREDGISSILSSKGIYDNGEALSLVYHLNNENIDTMNCILVPSAKGNDAWEELLKQGYRLKLYSFPEVKTKLYENIRSLYEVAEIESDNIYKEIFSEYDASITDVDRNVLENYSSFAQAVKTGNVLMPKNVLIETNAELIEYINLIKLKKESAALTEKQLEIKNVLSSSISIKAKAYSETFGSRNYALTRGSVPISVKVLDTLTNSIPLDNYRVYSSPKALFDYSKYHREIGLSSPARSKISIGAYLLWATKPTDKGEVVVSGYQTVNVDNFTDKKEVSLFIER